MATQLHIYRGPAGDRYDENGSDEGYADPLKLPYADESFDAVIGSGVLEHTAMEGESLKEVYRVLRRDGVFVVSYLPYAYSWNEWRRRSRGVDFHHKLERKTRGGLSMGWVCFW